MTPCEQGVTVSVNGDCYRAMLKEFLSTKIEEKGIRMNIYTFFLHRLFRSGLNKKIKLFQIFIMGLPDTENLTTELFSNTNNIFKRLEIGK